MGKISLKGLSRPALHILPPVSPGGFLLRFSSEYLRSIFVVRSLFVALILRASLELRGVFAPAPGACFPWFVLGSPEVLASPAATLPTGEGGTGKTAPDDVDRRPCLFCVRPKNKVKCQAVPSCGTPSTASQPQGASLTRARARLSGFVRFYPCEYPAHRRTGQGRKGHYF